MATVRILEPGDEALVEAFCTRHPDTTLFFANNVQAVGFANNGERYQGTYAAALDGDRIVALAAHYWNDTLILEAPAHLDAVVQAAAQASGRTVFRFVGPYEQARSARRALGLEEVPVVLDEREILYALDLPALRTPAGLAAGAFGFRLAALSDLDVLLPWRIAYCVETLGEVASPEMRAQTEAGLLGWIGSGRMWVLEQDGEIVSMTGFNAATPHVVQVGGVWTPPALRSRGYARAAVAASLLEARKQGARRSILFTPEKNAAARRCYEELGYVEIGDYGIVTLCEGRRPFG